ncbi:Lipid A Biosynthesis N-terminal domain-containing protein [Dysgonomonas macrotermitis]|uniref:Lipid A Biosynthesis N-terminal domain-containing protein n=2 Tax=Dysgonomonas macrotermitis TaxID=1346286 RepID=A0A1M5B160_9BACT|nr:lipid-A-disaccharide synthase N-terminal domain-containing protein [Dysgonomonas macrotermitis]SHF36189.1 Lipid A Biosynthesis N-terminal domain-containing protein [Dysgonomonas macrotermitis]
MDKSWYFIIGFLAQGLFSIRVLIQWVLSEKAKKVVSPTIYWQISLLASFLFSIYGWLRGDFAIILGQIFSYYIYIWNINNKNHWKEIYPIIRYIILVTPILAAGYVLYKGDSSIDRLFKSVPIPLLIFGSLGQIIFTFRFIYQWWYSQAKGESSLPVNFWLLSLVGSIITIAYGIFRKDPVLILGQSAGFIAYSRNLWLATKSSDSL